MWLWTLCSDTKKWKNYYTLRKWDTMGNVVDEIDKEDDAILTKKEYPDDFLDKINDIFNTYVFEVHERESYENDDNDTSGEYERTYTKTISPKDMIVICNKKPVGFMIESKSYAGGMNSKTTINGTVLYFDTEGLDNSYTVYDQNGRWRTTCTYTLVKCK